MIIRYQLIHVVNIFDRRKPLEAPSFSKTQLQLKELETKLQKATEELSEANKRNEQFKKETATQIAHLESQLAEKDNQVIIGIYTRIQSLAKSNNGKSSILSTPYWLK